MKIGNKIVHRGIEADGIIKRIEMKTVNELIRDLQALSSDRRELPVYIIAENGLELEPKVKMGGEFIHIGGAADRIIITWD